MHQVLLLFFGEFIAYVSEFLDADKEQDCFEVGFFAEAFEHFLLRGSTILPAGRLLCACGKDRKGENS